MTFIEDRIDVLVVNFCNSISGSASASYKNGREYNGAKRLLRFPLLNEETTAENSVYG